MNTLSSSVLVVAEKLSNLCRTAKPINQNGVFGHHFFLCLMTTAQLNAMFKRMSNAAFNNSLFNALKIAPHA
jgi:hypothetical protein